MTLEHNAEKLIEHASIFPTKTCPPRMLIVDFDALYNGQTMKDKR